MEESPALAALRARLTGTNINPDTLLATDYLNHFNEIIMMIELVPDMPEMLADAKAWQPLSYTEHFQRSQFVERDLAIEAYGMVAEMRRQRFEQAVRQAHGCVADALRQFDGILAAGGDDGSLRTLSLETTRQLHRLVDCISTIIHGGMVALDQLDIDGLFQAAPAAEKGDAPAANQGDAPAAASQDDIDALFK